MTHAGPTRDDIVAFIQKTLNELDPAGTFGFTVDAARIEEASGAIIIPVVRTNNRAAKTSELTRILTEAREATEEHFGFDDSHFIDIVLEQAAA